MRQPLLLQQLSLSCAVRGGIRRSGSARKPASRACDFLPCNPHASALPTDPQTSPSPFPFSGGVAEDLAAALQRGCGSYFDRTSIAPLLTFVLASHLAGGVAEDLAAALQRGCGSYFREDDKLYYQASGLLQRAEAAAAAGAMDVFQGLWGFYSKGGSCNTRLRACCSAQRRRPLQVRRGVCFSQATCSRRARLRPTAWHSSVALSCVPPSAADRAPKHTSFC